MKILIVSLLTMSSMSFANGNGKFMYRTEGSASGYNEGRTCDRALRNSLENAADICEEKGKSLADYEVGGCGYESSMFGYSKRVHEIEFNCR